MKKSWQLEAGEKNYFDTLKKKDQEIINSLFNNLDVKNTNALIDKVYEQYPYFTIHSKRPLNNNQERKKREEIKKIKKENKRQLFSIGYEGMSIDFYLDKLVKNNITLLCDVRNNPFSMKYGFSKKQLKKYCESLRIEYIHIPDLGIDTEERKSLNTFLDYQKLF